MDSYVHTQPKDQTKWIEEQLSKYSSRRNKFAVYHNPIFPIKFHADTDDITQECRTEWTPIFDKYNLTIAWENHHHQYKRTFPIRNKARAESGVVYMGDGAW